MRIGINSLFLIPNKHGGTEHYVRNLISNFGKVDGDNEYFIFTNKENSDTFGIGQKNLREIPCRFSAKSRVTRVFWEQAVLPFCVAKYRLDVLFSPAYVSPVAKFSKCKYIVTIHDVMYRHHPENYPLAQLMYFKLLLPFSAKRADKIITVSKNNKKDIVNYLSVPEDKITTIYTSGLPDNLQCDLKNEQVKSAIKERYKLYRSYILCVATFNPQKNIEGLLQAFRLVKSRYHFEHQLVLVGMQLRQTDKLMKIIGELGLSNYVNITGYVPDEDLPYLYSLADLYVLPSFFEGLGVTPLEAMACQCPVAASDIPAVREVVGDAAALFNPHRTEAIAATIQRILLSRELREQLLRKGSQRIKQFSWQKTAAETLKVFQDMMV